MRFPLRATALALTAVTLLGAGTVAASVTAAAYEVDVSAQAVAPAVDPIAAAAPLTAEAKAALLTAAREQHAREIALATARAAVKAKQARIERIRARIITVAKNQIGDRYSAGATGPSAFDCSGFTRFVYKVAAGKELPHYSRAQYTKVKKIPLKQARPATSCSSCATAPTTWASTSARAAWSTQPATARASRSAPSRARGGRAPSRASAASCLRSPVASAGEDLSDHVVGHGQRARPGR